jgi:hypothetical protein
MFKNMPAEDHCDGDITRITAAADGDASYPAMIVAGIEGIPLLTEENLEPGAEIHRIRIWRHPNIAKVSSHIASWNV